MKMRNDVLDTPDENEAPVTWYLSSDIFFIKSAVLNFNIPMEDWNSVIELFYITEFRRFYQSRTFTIKSAIDYVLFALNGMLL